MLGTLSHQTQLKKACLMRIMRSVHIWIEVSLSWCIQSKLWIWY